jgi:hypothetical protein
MRIDMAKIVTEAPRRGRANRSRKWGTRDALPLLQRDPLARTRADMNVTLGYGAPHAAAPRGDATWKDSSGFVWQARRAPAPGI